jgi:hypothetical protein
MATINDGALYLEVPGATEVQLRLGLAAARAVLDAAHVDYGKAFDASWKPEYNGDCGEGAMSANDWELNEAWWNAHRAATNVVRAAEPCDVRLLLWASHVEAEPAWPATREHFPDARRVPAADSGPHFQVAPARLTAQQQRRSPWLTSRTNSTPTWTAPASAPAS